ncbi:MAG: 4'-phosphopantetheinyl transferase superfamily protein [Phycisphaerales bacterium]|jgi:4'-phosphopantetheinyl transferase
MRISVWSQRAPDQRRKPKLARELLRQAVALEAGEERHVAHEDGRAPAVDGLSVSLSRAEGLAMCAVSDCEAIGLDVEQLRPWTELADMATLVSDPPPRDARSLLELWTRKEALAKAMGTGLLDDVRALAVPDRSPAIGEWMRRDGWLWIGCPCEKHHVAALVVRHPGDDAEGGYDVFEMRGSPAIRISSLQLLF